VNESKSTLPHIHPLHGDKANTTIRATVSEASASRAEIFELRVILDDE
jgi:hypothetical protein